MNDRPYGLWDKRLSKSRVKQNQRMEANAQYRFDEKYVDKDGKPILIKVLPSSGRTDKPKMRCKG